jgi:diguanylate cyclase (GGDEF)-like protein/PAS domain S-box-containing protein
MHSLIALISDFYWELDDSFRFTRFQRTGALHENAPADVERALGKTLWEIAGLAPLAVGMEGLRSLILRREAFRDIEWEWRRSSGGVFHFNVSGEPVYESGGAFAGYRGILRDISAQKRQEEDLQRFRRAMEASGDSIYIVDRETMRFVEVNETACKATGFTREELLTMGPQDLLLTDREAIEREYDAVIAAGPAGTINESVARNRKGTHYLYELQRRAIRFGDRWTIISIGRDITRRKASEKAELRFSRMYAAISGVNEAILLARTPEELYCRVCEAAVRDGQIVNASVMLRSPDSLRAQLVAIAGIKKEILDGVHISFDPELPEGRGLVGTAYRERRSCVSNDIPGDTRMQPWRKEQQDGEIVAGAAVPLIRNDESIGVLLFYSREKEAFDDEILQLLERMARNIVFALENFEREAERRQALEALRESEEKYRSILESIDEAYYEVDLSGTLMLANDAFCRMFGYAPEEMRSMSYQRYLSDEDGGRVFGDFNAVFRDGVPRKGLDWSFRHKRGQTLTCEGSVQLVRNAAGEPAGFRGMLRDVTERRRMEAALRESEERFRALTELSTDWYWEQDENYRFIQVNGDVQLKTGMPPAAYLGKTLWELPFDNLPAEQWLEHRARLDRGEAFSDLELRALDHDGAPRYLSISGVPVRDADGRLAGYRGTCKDITERKTAEERIRHLASHDILTGLPNRMMFSQVLGQTLQQARRYERRFAVMFIDLDHFKAVNDSLGHEAGDALLKEIAQRLVRSVRASDFVARLAGDEFVVLLHEAGEQDVLDGIARKIVQAVRMPVMLGTATRSVTASVGICVFPQDGEDEEALMRHADAAMYRVKHDSKDGFSFHAA